MMYLGNNPIGVSTAYNKELLVYSSGDTLGNDWIEYELDDVDWENNAIILKDATGIPLNEISAISTAALVIKPSLNINYGMILDEVIGLGYCIKNIGNNKIQFYKTDKTTMVNLIEKDTVIVDTMKLVYRNSNVHPNFSLIDNFPSTHLIHVKFTYYGPISSTFHVAAYTSDNQRVNGIGYGLASNKRAATGYSANASETITMSAGYDDYAGIIGMRTFNDQTTYSTCGIFDLYFWPNAMFNGNQYYVKSLHLACRRNNANARFIPVLREINGFTNVRIEKLGLGSNNNYDWVGPGTKLEVWDCGPIS